VTGVLAHNVVIATATTTLVWCLFVTGSGQIAAMKSGYTLSRAGLCPWDNRGKANSWPPPIHKNLHKKKKAKFCNIVTATSLLN
jgi:hypothetical protein